MRATRRTARATLPRVYRQEVATGTVLTHDFQSDDFEGEYEVIGFDEATGMYTGRHMEPSGKLIAAAEQHYLHSESPYLDYVDPFGPGRRVETRQEAFDREIMGRIEKAGTEFTFQFVSQERWAAMF
jgi:hypothetical protein